MPNTDHYVPDPEADATAVVEGLFDHLRAALEERGLPGDLVPAMRARHAALLADGRSLIVDEPARHNLRMTLALLAGYEVLRPVVGREDALTMARAAFVEPLAAAVREGTRAMLDAAPDPFRAMVELARSRETQDFGAGFEFRHPADDDGRFYADVHRCFYHDVLAAGGAPELTPVMCAFDRNWIDAIDPDRHGFRFERATTIGLGGSHCPFHFWRV